MQKSTRASTRIPPFEYNQSVTPQPKPLVRKRKRAVPQTDSRSEDLESGDSERNDDPSFIREAQAVLDPSPSSDEADDLLLFRSEILGVLESSEVVESVDEMFRSDLLAVFQKADSSDVSIPSNFTKVYNLKPPKKKRKLLSKTNVYQMMWQSKHGITDAAMRDWKAMAPYIDHRELKSGQMCRLYRSYFPLMPLYTLNVSQEVTPYYENGVLRKTRTAKFPFFALCNDVIPMFLESRPSLDDLTIGAIYGDVAKEYCHGRVNRENPLLTMDHVITGSAETSLYLGETC